MVTLGKSWTLSKQWFLWSKNENTARAVSWAPTSSSTPLLKPTEQRPPSPQLVPERSQLRIPAAQLPLQCDSTSARVSIPGERRPHSAATARFTSNLLLQQMPKVSRSARRPSRPSIPGKAGVENAQFRGAVRGIPWPLLWSGWE